MHKKELFVQESAAGSQAVHKRRLFVQESAVGGSAVHKERLFVQESAAGAPNLVVYGYSSAAAPTSADLIILEALWATPGTSTRRQLKGSPRLSATALLRAKKYLPRS